LYTIEYDDGAVETKVPIQMIRVTNSGKSEKEGEESSFSSDSEESHHQQHHLSSSSSSSSSFVQKEDMEWHVVQRPSKERQSMTTAMSLSHVPPPPLQSATTGLTKKQRENRRKKEKLKELKELVRSQAQVRHTGESNFIHE
jgi:hypothetical protein